MNITPTNRGNYNIAATTRLINTTRITPDLQDEKVDQVSTIVYLEIFKCPQDAIPILETAIGFISHIQSSMNQGGKTLPYTPSHNGVFELLTEAENQKDIEIICTHSRIRSLTNNFSSHFSNTTKYTSSATNIIRNFNDLLDQLNSGMMDGIIVIRFGTTNTNTKIYLLNRCEITNAVATKIKFYFVGKNVLRCLTFTNCEYNDARFNFIEQSRCHYQRCRFINTTFVKANMFQCKLIDDTTFTRGSFAQASIENSTVRDTTFIEVNFSLASIKKSTVTNTTFIGVNFTQASIKNSTVTNTIFHNVDLTLANLRGTTFRNVQFEDVDIYGANFSGVKFEGECSITLKISEQRDTNGYLKDALDPTKNNNLFTAINSINDDTLKQSLVKQIIDWVKGKIPNLNILSTQSKFNLLTLILSVYPNLDANQEMKDLVDYLVISCLPTIDTLTTQEKFNLLALILKAYPNLDANQEMKDLVDALTQNCFLAINHLSPEKKSKVDQILDAFDSILLIFPDLKKLDSSYKIKEISKRLVKKAIENDALTFINIENGLKIKANLYLFWEIHGAIRL